MHVSASALRVEVAKFRHWHEQISKSDAQQRCQTDFTQAAKLVSQGVNLVAEGNLK